MFTFYVHFCHCKLLKVPYNLGEFGTCKCLFENIPSNFIEICSNLTDTEEIEVGTF